jgi:hypothetical protein
VGVVRDKWWEEQSPQLSLPTRAQMPEDGSARGALNGLPPTNNSRTPPPTQRDSAKTYWDSKMNRFNHSCLKNKT